MTTSNNSRKWFSQNMFSLGWLCRLLWLKVYHYPMDNIHNLFQGLLQALDNLYTTFSCSQNYLNFSETTEDFSLQFGRVYMQNLSNLDV